MSFKIYDKKHYSTMGVNFIDPRMNKLYYMSPLKQSGKYLVTIHTFKLILGFMGGILFLTFFTRSNIHPYTSLKSTPFTTFINVY